MGTKKDFYRTRVQLYSDTLTSLPDDCVLAFLPKQGVYVLKTLIQYAHRRINWVQEILNENSFLTPDTITWDTLQAVIAETEEQLMSACDITPMIAALECICNSLQLGLGNTIAPLETMRDSEVSGAFDYSREMPDADLSSLSDTECCETAQLFFALGYETITEIVLPASAYAFDTLAPAVAALVIGVTGGLAAPAIVGVYLYVELIQEIMEIGYKAAESNLDTWMWSVKDDIICNAYYALKSGMTAKQAAAMVYDMVIAPSESISYGDKLICKLFFSGWTMTNADIARSKDSTWAQENIVAGYCAACVEPECYGATIIGSDWWACPRHDVLEVPAADVRICYNAFDVPAGQTLVGFVFDWTAGDMRRYLASNCDDPCAGDSVTFDKLVEDLDAGGWVMIKDGEIDENEAHETLYPSATLNKDVFAITGPTTGAACIRNRTSVAGEWTILYWVFKGTSP